MKTVLPWFAVIVLLASNLFLLTRNKGAQAELADLRQQSEQLKSVQAEQEERKRVEGQSDELVRLRKDNQDLHRLRNEVRQLREQQKQQVAGTAQPGQTRTGRSPVGPADPQQQLQQQLQQLLAENESLRVQNAASQQARTLESQVNACINNLRIIEGAKDQWALENKKVAGTVVNAVDIQPFLKGNVIPACPAGGVYALYPVGAAPVCSLPGHALPQQ